LFPPDILSEVEIDKELVSTNVLLPRSFRVLKD
jgi:hypothetical protein